MPRPPLLTRGLLPAALVLLAALSCASAGATTPTSTPAEAYRRVLDVYEHQGTVPPCRFSSAQLSAALKGVDVYGQQYFADFTSAIQNALSQRASGACTHLPGGAALRGAGAGRAPAVPTSITASTEAGPPAPIVILGVLLVLGLLAGLAAAVARTSGLALAPPGRWRHLLREASWRSEGVWDDFRDWLRVR